MSVPYFQIENRVTLTIFLHSFMRLPAAQEYSSSSSSLEMSTLQLAYSGLQLVAKQGALLGCSGDLALIDDAWYFFGLHWR